MNNFLKPGELYKLKIDKGYINYEIGFLVCNNKYYFTNTNVTITPNNILLFLSTKFLRPEFPSRFSDAENFNVFLHENKTICMPDVHFSGMIYKKIQT